MLYVLFDQEGQLRVSMTYRPSYVLPSLAKQLAEYFELAISTILQHPQATVGDLSLISTRDRQRLCSWNGYIPDFRPNCVHELIQERARAQPDSLAISGWDGQLTYRELDDLASQLSVSLIDHGVVTAQCIPLCFEKSRWTIVAMLAVMKAGAIFVPLDPSQPLNRLIDICRRTNAKLILSSPAQAAFAKSLGQDVMKVGEHIRNPNRNYISPLAVDPEQPAYILFTSGSTGEPKGAIVPHSSYCYAAQTHIQAFSLDNTSRVLQISSYAFDVSVMEILSSLVAGATVCVISESEQSQMMTDGTWPMPVTHAFLTPSLAGSLDAAKVPWLKTMVLLGEPLSTSHITQWGASCNLLNAYGPTECAVINTVSPRLSSRNNSDPRNIGWGLNVRCWIVDPHDHNQLVPVGAVGELIMNGPAVGLGYLGDERTTSDIFIEPPAWLRDFHPDGAQWRLYKTGDLVRYEISDGSLRFEGRKDRQIKVRGQRVELEDVEHHIRRCFPGVKEVVIDQVMIRQGHVLTAIAPRLVACIWGGLVNESNGVDGKVISGKATNGSPGENNRTQDLLLDPSPEFHAAAATVLAQLREILPGYMIPDYFVPISKVPRTASGKTDRAQLRRRISVITAENWRALQDLQRSQRLPMGSATEEKLHSILVGLLGIPSESVGADDSFFHLGGDSILAMKMAAKARAEGMDISSHDILRYPTISEWAEIVNAHPTRPSNHETYMPYSLVTDADRESVLSSSYLAKEHPFTAANVEDIVPVVESQRFYVTHSSPVSMAELFPHGLDIGRLRKACSATVAHHSILRTLFAVSNERYFQVILREVEPAFEVLECDDPEAYMSQESRRKLEPSTALWSMPVGFTVVASRASQNVVFIIRISHAQYDGPSLSVLWNSIVAAYRGYTLEKAAQFKDVVYHRLGSDHEEAFSFWRKYLQDAPPAAWDPLNVTGISSSPENQANPTTVRQEIDQLGKLPEVTMATLVKAALAWSLSERGACNDIILGQVVHGRGGTLPDMDKVLGPCINVLPIRIQINSHWTVLDFLRHVQAQQLVTVPHDFVSLNDIVRKCGTLDNAKFGCIVHHQGVQATQTLELDHNIRSSASLSWANSNPTSGQVGVISIERGSSLDLLITAPTEAMDQSTAELLGTKLADTIRLFFNFPTCPMTQLGQAAHVTSKSFLS